MRHTDSKVRRGASQMRKQCSNKVYDSMVKFNSNEAAKKAFYRPPYGVCNSNFNKSNEKTEE